MAANIVFVDDTEMYRQMFLKYLNSSAISSKVNVKVINSGFELLTVLEENKPDLIFLDVQMEGMDGYQTCRMIKANPKYNSVKIVFLTAQDSVTDQMKGQSAGAVEYLPKPFTRDTLIERIQRYVGDLL